MGMAERKLALRPSASIKNAHTVESQALLQIVSGRLLHQLEFIHAPPDIRFGDVDVALGVDVQRVTMREFAQLMAGPAELRDFVPLMIEDVDEFVAAVGDDHVFLRRIAGKTQPPRRAPRIGRFFLVADLIQMFFLKFPILSNT